MRNALFALVLLAATPAAAQTAEPQSFDFKGVALGISLQRMREIRAADAHVANARVVCTGDPEVGVMSYFAVHLSAEEAAAGVRRCAYYDPPRYPGSTFEDVAGLNMGGGDYFSNDYAFDFFPDPASGELRLFRIALPTNIGARHDVLPALRGRFGPPTETLDEPVQNRMGAQFGRTITRWANAHATLTVTAPSGRLDRMSVVYRLTDLANRADAAVREQRSSVPNRM